MPSLFDDMYIPWTPRCLKSAFARITANAAAAAAQAASATQDEETEQRTTTAQEPTKPKQFCARTLKVVRAIINHALDPFPEALQALAAAFVAYHRDELDLPEALL